MKHDENAGPDIAKLQKLAELLPVKERLERGRAIDRVILHPKQREFLRLTSTVSEAALLGANQSGKSTVGAYILVYHLTGDYPPDWEGRRYNRAIIAWALGPTAAHVREVLQSKLVGNIANPDGLIPLDAYDTRNGRLAISKSHGLPDAVDFIRIKHKSGGTSVLYFKSHEQGRVRLQGSSIDFIWNDEDVPLPVWSELLARQVATNGSIICTFTPVAGMMPVAQRFIQEPSPSRGYVTMTLMDALHIPAERHQAIIDSFQPYERDARVYGIPSAGAGKVFHTLEEQIAEGMPNVPSYWPLLWGLDFGHSEKHCFAATLGAWDRDNDIIHIIHAIRIRGGLPRDHAAAIRTAMNGQAGDVPCAWPHDGAARPLASMQTTMQLYKAEGLRMLAKHSTLEKGGFDTEAGVALMAQRFRDGRLKVARHLQEWFQEYRMYHRLESGLINKQNDDLMSASRMLVIQIRSAKEFDNHRPGYHAGEFYRRPQTPQYVKGSINNQPYDLFTGRPFGGGATHDRQGRPLGRRDYDIFNP